MQGAGPVLGFVPAGEGFQQRIADQRRLQRQLLSAMMIADPIDAVNEDEVGAPPCGAEGAWGVVSGPGRAKLTRK